MSTKSWRVAQWLPMAWAETLIRIAALGVAGAAIAAATVNWLIEYDILVLGVLPR